MDKQIGYKHFCWTVTGNKYRENAKSYHPAICDCGTVGRIRGDHFTHNVKSCGCYRARVQKERLTKHGHTTRNSKSSIYGVWVSMKARCHDPHNDAYKDYGARGITVCEDWQDFCGFFADMGEPAKGMMLDRIDSDKGYSKDNCKWSTRAQQNRNYSKRNVYIMYAGVSLVRADWARAMGITVYLFKKWLYKEGMTMDQISERVINLGLWDGVIDRSFFANYNQYATNSPI